jgi:hypothetical protein
MEEQKTCGYGRKQDTLWCGIMRLVGRFVGAILPSAERLTLETSDHDLPTCDAAARVSRLALQRV